MDRTAPQFMKLMNRVTVNSLIGAMCRITEPASTHGQQNLTVRSIEKRLPWTDGRKPEAEQIAQRCDCLHRQLKKGRNKRLAHNDLNTILADTGFPLPLKIAKEVIDQLECLIELAYAQSGPPLGGVVLGGKGDVRDFKKALGDSVLYERALADPRLPEDLKTEMLLWRLEISEP